MQMVAPCSCRMAKEHDIQMDVDMLKSQHNRLHSQLGQGVLCEHCNTCPHLVAVCVLCPGQSYSETPLCRHT